MSPNALGIVPARGGSKRIPRKNLKPLDGKPLIAHTIEQCDEAAALDETVVSTDSEEIGEVAREYGGNVPFQRPAELADDETPAYNCVSHTLNWHEQRGRSFDIVAMIPVTTPLRLASDIDDAIAELQASDADSVIGVSEYLTPPQWSVTENDEGYLYEYFEKGCLWSEETPRSQDLPRLRHPNGAIFATHVSSWWEHETFYMDQVAGYEMPPKRGIDVDEPWELELLRALYERTERES